MEGKSMADKKTKPEKELTEEQKKAAALSRKKSQVKKKISELKEDMKIYSQLSRVKFNKELKSNVEEIFQKYGDVLIELYKDELINELKEMKPKDDK